MNLYRRLRPHGSRPACLRCCSSKRMRELALDHDALVGRGVPVPARVHARRKLLHDLRGTLVWIPHTTDICSPGCLGSTGFHGMASLAVKVPWVAPAFAPAVGVTVPRCCANDSVVIQAASATTTLLFSIGSLLFRICNSPSFGESNYSYRTRWYG
jgi:hypothetical protein